MSSPALHFVSCAQKSLFSASVGGFYKKEWKTFEGVSREKEKRRKNEKRKKREERKKKGKESERKCIVLITERRFVCTICSFLVNREIE